MTRTDLSARSRPRLILDEVEVATVERLSPSFVRVELAGAALGDFGVRGPLWDQRVKLLFPGAGGALPRLDAGDPGWYAAWRRLPAPERGHLRTYTVRAVRGSGTDTRVVVDLVVHPGTRGPASDWAARARPGDRLVLVGPRRGVPFGGVEFAPPPGTRRLLLAGDETAVPAVGAILDGLPDGTDGTAFLEVPTAADIQDLRCPVGITVVWLPRENAPRGEPVRSRVLTHLGLADSPVRDEPAPAGPLLWETPRYSSAGDRLAPDPEAVSTLAPRAAASGPVGGASGVPGLYAWIAGEAGVVTGLRRRLVGDLGLARHQVAFMGYWRRGVPAGA